LKIAGVLNQDIRSSFIIHESFVRKWKKNFGIAQNWVLKEPFIIEALGTGHAIMCQRS
jgi:hypothetical protein